MATNVETGEPVLLNNGYLPEAIMASGTLPSLFAPVKIDGKLLIDGGVVNNYPINEVINAGANLIIGVDVQQGLSNREALSSATEILWQINNYKTVADMIEKSELTDIYIKPEIKEYSILDFDKSDAIIKLGELSALKKKADLMKISVGYDKLNLKENGIQAQDQITIKRLILKGDNGNYTKGYIKGKLRLSLGEKTTFGKLQQGFGNLSATGNI